MSDHIAKTNDIIDSIPLDATDEEMDRMLLSAFATFAEGEIAALGLSPDIAQPLTDALVTPFKDTP